MAVRNLDRDDVVTRREADASAAAERRWAAIEATQARLAPPVGAEDMGEVVRRSLAAYCQEVESGVVDDWGRDVPEVFRRAARRFRGAGLWSDFVLAFAPTVAVGLAFAVVRLADVALAGWLAWAGAAAAPVVWFLAWVGRHRFSWLEGSMGALAAGFAWAGLVAVLLPLQLQRNADATLLAAQSVLGDLAMTSLRSKIENGRYVRPENVDPLLSIDAARLSERSIVYTASSDRFRGELVARVGVDSGTVTWTTRGEEVRLGLAAGKVLSTAAHSWTLETAGRDLKLAADPTTIGVRPSRGDCVVVAYDPASRRVERAQRLVRCDVRSTATSTEQPPEAGQRPG
jgi:hypothetical protein